MNGVIGKNGEWEYRVTAEKWRGPQKTEAVTLLCLHCYVDSVWFTAGNIEVETISTLCVNVNNMYKKGPQLQSGHSHLKITNMNTLLYVLVALVGVALAAPQDAVKPIVKIVSQSSSVNADGTFTSSFETEDGIKFEQSGFIKPGLAPRSGAEGDEEGTGDIQVVQGSFSYTAPDGTPISLTYTADETGYHPEGAHLPTPHPIPEAIQRSLSSNRREETRIQNGERMLEFCGERNTRLRISFA
ncbi:hypothetical protein L9F63_008432, partial [Diploptera punctata]